MNSLFKALFLVSAGVLAITLLLVVTGQHLPNEPADDAMAPVAGLAFIVTFIISEFVNDSETPSRLDIAIASYFRTLGGFGFLLGIVFLLIFVLFSYQNTKVFIDPPYWAVLGLASAVIGLYAYFQGGQTLRKAQKAKRGV